MIIKLFFNLTFIPTQRNNNKIKKRYPFVSEYLKMYLILQNLFYSLIKVIRFLPEIFLLNSK